MTQALVRLPLFSLAIHERLILAAALSTVILGAFGLDEALRELRRREFVLFSAGTAAILIGVLMALWPLSRQLGLSAECMRSSAIPFLIPLVTIPPGGEKGAVTIPNGPGHVRIRRDGLRYVIEADMQQLSELALASITPAGARCR